jgi:hypothetical protein
MDTVKADLIIDTVVANMDVEWYRRYVQSILPATHADLFLRFLFAYASVHTTWTSNLALYTALKDYTAWLGDQDKLKAAIIDSRAGLYNNRTKYISEFSTKFWARPEWYWKQDEESWVQYRDRIKDNSLGLGPAKSSFVIEMAYPDIAEVVCTDVHFMGIYGLSSQDVGKMHPAIERAAEVHWVNRMAELGIPAVLARWGYWDAKKHKSNPRFWTRVLEKPMTELRLEA